MRNGFTPSQKVILEVLSDGKQHDKYELLEALNDPNGNHQQIKDHIYRMRARLNPIGQDIVCVVRYRKTYYQHVRLLASPYNGYS